MNFETLLKSAERTFTFVDTKFCKIHGEKVVAEELNHFRGHETLVINMHDQYAVHGGKVVAEELNHFRGHETPVINMHDQYAVQ